MLNYLHNLVHSPSFHWKMVDIGHSIARFIGTESKHWRNGFIGSEDPTCSVHCQCGYKFPSLVSDYEISICPQCGSGYITEFRCYRVPALFAKMLPQPKPLTDEDREKTMKLIESLTRKI